MIELVCGSGFYAAVAVVISGSQTTHGDWPPPPSADLRRGNVVILGDLLNRLLVRHRIPGDASFEFSTQVPSFSLTHFGFISGCRPLKD